MADNVDITAGSGTTIATDDVAGVQYQRVKLDVGGDGAASPLVRGQQAKASCLPVTLASDEDALTVDLGANNDVTVQGEDAENAAASANPVQVGGRYDLTPRTLGDGDVGAIAMDADGAVHVADGGNSLTVDNGGTFAVQVDAALPAGTNAIGKLAANSGVDIGDVDVLSLPGVAGVAAEDAAVSGNPVLVAGRYDATDRALDDGDVGTLSVNASGAVRTAQDNDIDAGNSTTTPLTGGATFTGTGADVRNYSSISIQIYADVDSAAGGMQFQFSTDNSNWDDVYSFTLDFSASPTRRFQFPVTARYFRVVYTNGAGAQSAFRVQTILHRTAVSTSIHRLGDNASPDRSATVVKSALIAQVNGSGDFVPIQANASGILKVGGSVDVDSITGTDAENAAVSANPVLVGGRYDATPRTLGDGDAGAVALDADGAVQVSDGGNSLTVDNAGTFAVQAASAGDVAHSATDSGNPVKIGAKAEATPSAQVVTDGDRTDLIADLDGHLLTRQAASADLLQEAISNTDGASTAFTGDFAANGANIKNAVTALSVFRTDAGTSMAYIDFRDGAAGSVIYRIPLPPSGGATMANGGTPIFVTSANTALAYDVSSALTTVYISVSGYKMR